MNDFTEMFCEMLPINSPIQKQDNQFKKVFDKTVGEFMENQTEIFDQLFLTTATAGWLDAFGKDYGVPRRLNESDDEYRIRIIQEKNDHLTPSYLESVYGVKLYNAFDGFNPMNDDLTSDNPYLSNFYMGIADEETQKVLEHKFILDKQFLWYNEGTGLDYIYNTSDEGILKDYMTIYESEGIPGFFRGNTSIKRVRLTLPNTRSVMNTFKDCTSLISANLYLPNLTNYTFESGVFTGCTAIKEIVFNVPNMVGGLGTCRALETLEKAVIYAPKITSFSSTFYHCYALKYVDITIPPSLVDTFMSLVDTWNLDLDTLIVNGEEVDLS